MKLVDLFGTNTLLVADVGGITYRLNPQARVPSDTRDDQRDDRVSASERRNTNYHARIQVHREGDRRETSSKSKIEYDPPAISEWVVGWHR